MNYKQWYKEKIKDIKEHPENHNHTFEALKQCCITPDGSLDFAVMDAHSNYVDLGNNCRTKCDVISGPCACGAWH